MKCCGGMNLKLNTVRNVYLFIYLFIYYFYISSGLGEVGKSNCICIICSLNLILHIVFGSENYSPVIIGTVAFCVCVCVCVCRKCKKKKFFLNFSYFNYILRTMFFFIHKLGLSVYLLLLVCRM